MSRNINDKIPQVQFPIRILFILQQNTNCNAPMTLDELCQNVYGISKYEWHVNLSNQTKKDRRKAIRHNLEELMHYINSSEESAAYIVTSDDDGIKSTTKIYWEHPFTESEVMMMAQSHSAALGISAREKADIYRNLMDTYGLRTRRSKMEKAVKTQDVPSDLNFARALMDEDDEKNAERFHAPTPYSSPRRTKNNLTNDAPHKDPSAMKFEPVPQAERSTVSDVYDYIIDILSSPLNQRARITFNLKAMDRNGTHSKLIDRSPYREFLPLSMGIANGRCHVLGVFKASTRVYSFPIDIMADINTVKDDTDAGSLSSFFTKENYETLSQYLAEHPDMSYNDPEYVTMKILDSTTAYTALYNKFGSDFERLMDYDENGVDYVTVYASPYAVINWCMLNSDKVEIVGPEDVVEKMKTQITNLKNLYFKK